MTRTLVMDQGENLLRRLPAQDLEAERYVLAAALRDAVSVDLVSAILTPEDFYRSSHATVWRTILDLRAGNAPIETTSLLISLRQQGLLEDVGGPVELVSIESAAASGANAIYYAERIVDAARLRRAEAALLEGMRELHESRDSTNERLGRVESRVLEATQSRATKRPATVQELLDETLKHLESVRSGRAPGLPFGVRGLDEATLGLNPGDLTIVGARPAAGKSTFAANVALNALLADPTHRVVIVSLEMLSTDVLLNLMCLLAGVNSQAVRAGIYSEHDGNEVLSAGKTLAAAPLKIVGSEFSADMSAPEIRSWARRWRAQGNLDLLIVDYLQRVRADYGRDRSHEQDVSQIARDLRSLAAELRVPVLAMAQLNRKVEDRNDHRPRLSDLRESGSLEQEAALVLLLHRENYYMSQDEARAKGVLNRATMIVAKNRFGPAGVDVPLRFDPTTGRFSDSLESAPPRREAHYDRPRYGGDA